jgi:RES domain-containing protein
MELWRISNYPDLSGIGGIKASGRWHTRGKPIVYLADHPSSALLEMLVRMDRDLVPPTYMLLRVSIPNHLFVGQLEPDELPTDWREKRHLTRYIGDQWLRRAETALLRVPSAIAHAENLLLNPAHALAQSVTVIEVIRAPFDARLVGSK